MVQCPEPSAIHVPINWRIGTYRPGTGPYRLSQRGNRGRRRTIKIEQGGAMLLGGFRRSEGVRVGVGAEARFGR
ncbi:hypothetical protein GW17_00034932 [Ensete ventricosum]|nr:hypothetical protein GW17_00034932 [Ensete ventricosum]